MCRILAGSCHKLANHIDRGLFNLVIGTAADLGDIVLHIAFEWAGHWICCLAASCCYASRFTASIALL